LVAFDFARDLNWLSDHVQDLLVHRAPVSRNQQEKKWRAAGLADEEHRRNAAADTTDGAAGKP
jgi:hypothetical protein